MWCGLNWGYKWIIVLKKKIVLLDRKLRRYCLFVKPWNNSQDVVGRDGRGFSHGMSDPPHRNNVDCSSQMSKSQYVRNTGKFSSINCRFSSFLAVASDNELGISCNHITINLTVRQWTPMPLRLHWNVFLSFFCVFLPAENKKQEKQIRVWNIIGIVRLMQINMVSRLDLSLFLSSAWKSICKARISSEHHTSIMKDSPKRRTPPHNLLNESNKWGTIAISPINRPPKLFDIFN